LESILSINKEKKSIVQTSAIPIQPSASQPFIEEIQSYSAIERYYIEPERNIIIQGVS
jgi:hypothetical protein